MVFVLDVFSWLLGIVPHAVLRGVASTLAFLLFSVLRIRRRVVFKNLEIVFGNTLTAQEKARIGRTSIANFILTILEFFGSQTKFSDAKVEIKGEEHLRAAVEANNGVYVMCIHMGNWELMCSIGSRMFKPVHAVVKPIGGKTMAEWVRKKRASNGMLEVPRHGTKRAHQRITEELNSGGIIGFIVDQRRKKGVQVPLFGVPAWTNASLFRLWRTQPAPIIPLLMHRTGPQQHVLKIFPPLEVAVRENQPLEDFLVTNSLRMNQMVERMISERPQEYFWMHDRWKE